MIPREILKKIRQIEIRTNRIVTESAERGCVRSTSRSTPHISNALTNHRALRLGLRPQPRAVQSGARVSARFTVRQSVASDSCFAPASVRTLKRRKRRVPASPNSKPIEFDGFGNCGEFAIIKRQGGGLGWILIPSNSRGLELATGDASPTEAMSKARRSVLGPDLKGIEFETFRNQVGHN